MFKTETKELKMNNEFRKKIKMICKFACEECKKDFKNFISRIAI